MIRKNDYFKLGLFIILGTGMLLAMVIILGAGRFFETTYPLETYFDESVNGLSVGSPVKLRGVQVGRVSQINFVTNIYPEAREREIRYVYVLCEINPDLFDDMSEEEFDDYVRRESKRGMRIRPTSLGLTGQLFLNTVYQDAESNPPLPLDWTPEFAYVPSVPSTLSRVEEAVTTISKTLSSLKQEDLQSIITDVKSIVGTIDDFMKTQGGQEAGERMLDILQSTRGILSRTDKLLSDPAAEAIIPNVSAITANVSRITEESADNIINAAAETRAAIASFKQASQVLSRTLTDPRMDKAMGEIAPTLENISQASADLAAAVSKIHALVNRVNGNIAAEEGALHSIIEDTREVLQNVKELTEDAKRYPSGVLFGNPPTKPNPETK
ncbi:MAG: MlaD family protein [Pseudodesulfovibrio sp.]|jgi:paraquat-inducible protein B|uniref:Mammalian cell entry protein n=1 Tax=Pseudodesulfovibrio indicus TaxID=1716143 RepID=A0A126QR56_9BACT|nr:MlaD family protein [Pseudodesulfovibrio indicus]AMK12238.1 mammalian cell entry protein [Pseudodesulfovibrio indicus]TDT86560.1 paraquat-inducible protein B [Pseudodesulfovibrio indicus]